ncbi:DegT/DnrJ/EryC1/StrS family aminotransferase [Streptomyces sp. NPDC049577]|uniref:DegT/DnrJ/EryC1/StrS family aminotransferase n=1 Tax=Streptomyces sp. NPDC049577 TaxID=3155153 RepID=UPI0034464611
MGTQQKLATAGIGPGDEVVVPSFAGPGPADAVRGTGASPVFADIHPGSLCLDPASVAAALTSRTSAVVYVRLFGFPLDLTALQSLAASRGLLLVEHSTATPADDPERRRANAAYFNARLTGVVTPVTGPGGRHGYHSYVVRVPGNGRPDRDAFARALRARGVPCHVPVQTPVHRLPSYRRELWLPETERGADECLALPVGSDLSRRELQRIVSACNALGGPLPAAAA